MVTTVSRTGYLSLRQAAAWLGMGSDRSAARRLQRLLETLERRDGVELLRRDGDGGGTRLRVTRAILRDYLPEHWSRRERVAGVVRAHLAEQDRRIQKLSVENRLLGHKVAEIMRRIGLAAQSGSDHERPQRPAGEHTQ